MAHPAPQSFENHVRLVPAYHFVAFGILAINLIWSLYKIVASFSGDRVIGLLLAIALLIIFFHARLFALAVQNRVIRLEMTLRMEKLLPPDLRPRIKEFAVGQLIALRFASDEELSELARKVLQEKITAQKEIKRMVKNWNPDYMRA
jgi:dolichyl-phosphate-mannose--protein O-mannosyl transferase